MTPLCLVNAFLRDRWLLCQMEQELRHGMAARHVELGYSELAKSSQDDARSAYLQAASIQFLLGLNTEIERKP
jgi:hypothetical protein